MDESVVLVSEHAAQMHLSRPRVGSSEAFRLGSAHSDGHMSGAEDGRGHHTRESSVARVFACSLAEFAPF